MLYSSGLYKDRWGPGCSIPDVSKMEAKLWLYFLAITYIEAGFEGIHWGRLALMAHDDPQLEHCSQLLAMIRSYARKNARRHFILNDAHSPRGGFLVDEKHLLDFNSSVLCIEAKTDNPLGGILLEGYLDAIDNRSRGGISPSGWTCKNLPCLVAFADSGISADPGRPAEGYFIRGYDEITWFSLKSEEEQEAWLEYAFNWIRKTDPNAYMQMPVSLLVTDGTSQKRYKANIMSPACPNGTGLEVKIKELWTR